MQDLLLALLLAASAAQSPSPPNQANHAFFNADLPPLTEQERDTIQAFGQCVAQRSAERAAETLAEDFTTRSYQSKLRLLSRNNETCFRARGRMRSANVLFAGAMAEALIERGGEPLNARLARAAQAPAVPAFSPSDRMAICVVRSGPDQVAQLFQAEPASDGEAAAAEALAPAVELCGRGGPRLQVSVAGLRAMLATAAFRSISASTSS